MSRNDFYICDRGFPHIQKTRFDDFHAAVLGLGDLTSPSRDLDAVAVVFDLAGFTKFCTQIDPQLAISEYLAAFIDWLFDSIKTFSLTEERYGAKKARATKRKSGKTAVSAKLSKAAVDDDGTIATFATLPFFAKFMGDGVLFLWNTKDLPAQTICAIPAIMLQVCAAYDLDFLPKIAQGVTDPPETLRCGIARGKVFSVGNGDDFVGPCINMASRLQHISVQVAFARRGFNADKFMDAHVRSHFLLKRVSIRGIGENELVYIDRLADSGLKKREQKVFHDVSELRRETEGDSDTTPTLPRTAKRVKGLSRKAPTAKRKRAAKSRLSSG